MEIDATTNMKYTLAIFDMDGTILDTLEDLTDSLNVSLNAFSMPERTLEEVRSFVGNGIHNLIEKAVPERTTSEEIEDVFEFFMPYYQKNCANKTKPYDGIVEVIQSLRQRGIKTAVVSNKADNAVQELCKQYFSDLFDFSIGEKPGNRKKPAPDAVLETLRNLGISKKDAVYIGDSEVDVATAKNSQLDCIAVTWGFRSTELLKDHGATVFAHNPEELLTVLHCFQPKQRPQGQSEG